MILRGNLAPAGAVAKITGKEGERFRGHARVFGSEESALKAILKGRVRKGHVVVIRYEGPKGGPGRPCRRGDSASLKYPSRSASRKSKS